MIRSIGKNVDKIKNSLKKQDEMYQAMIEMRQAMIEMRLDDMQTRNMLPAIYMEDKKLNEISEYWTGHTVLDKYFLSNKASLDYCNIRFSLYPYFREMSHMDDDYSDKIVLDYGCGPGNDLVWFAQRSKKLIGMDVSITALRNAQYRLGLLNELVNCSEIRLYLLEEKESETIPLDDNSVDYVSCQGVLMHTSSPSNILKEFRRVIDDTNKTDDCKCCIMVYNRESIWFHLYVAYYLRFIDDSIFEGVELNDRNDLDELFRRSTDGVNCPKADCFTPEQFEKMCIDAGFRKVEYEGGYPNNLEPRIAKQYLARALKDPRLEKEHKDFLREVTFDKDDFPVYKNKLCCIGGVYRLYV